MDGWIKLHRKITRWEWYEDANTFRVYIHMLLRANSKDARWHGEDIKRGQLITSIAHLSKELDLSPKQIRTSISKLKKTGELASKRANNATLITICNYDGYQGDNFEVGQTNGYCKGKPRANPGQTKGNKQERKEEDKEEENIIKQKFEIFRQQYPGRKLGLDIEMKNFCKKNKGQTVDLLLPALEKEKQARKHEAAKDSWTPEWKNLSTWINKKCWEQEHPEFRTTINGNSQRVIEKMFQKPEKW